MAMESNRAVVRGKTMVGPTSGVGLEPKLGVVNQQASNLDAMLTDIQQLVSLLDKKLADVLLPTIGGQCSEEPVKEATAPLADYLEKQYKKAGSIRDHLQELVERVAL